MLSKPESGWSTITIGSWSDRCSYLDDVPYMLTKAIDASCRTHTPQAVEFDAEGHKYILVICDHCTYIITDGDLGYVYRTVEISNKELCRQIIDDIRQYLDDWAVWPSHVACRPREHEDEIGERKADLAVYCNILERRHLDGKE